MFVVLLRFSSNKQRAGELMGGHNAWLKSGFEDNVFLVAGSLKPGMGGAIVASNTDMEEVEVRIGRDPFVAEDVVTAEILEIGVAKTDRRLEFLLN